MHQKGLLLVVSGPSGTGKGTVLKHITEWDHNIRYSISMTTRKPRIGELDGVNYFFRTVSEFKKLIENDEMVEWVNYCDNYYGTPRKFIDECLEKGQDVILEIEVEGAKNIMDRFPDCVSIFILPPSMEKLADRIKGRGTEIDEVIQKRLAKAEHELTFVNRYKYVVVNDEIQDAIDDITSIIHAEKLRFDRNSDILTRLNIL